MSATTCSKKRTPLTEEELIPILIEERIRAERETLLAQQQSDSKGYLPKDRYQAGETLVFPALNWEKGKVVGMRPGVNPALGEFEVIMVEFENGVKRQFAAGLAEHALNQPLEIALDDPMLNPANVIKTYGRELEGKLTAALKSDEDLVQIAGRWFPRALLVDVNVGHLESLRGRPRRGERKAPAHLRPDRTGRITRQRQPQADRVFNELFPAGGWAL